MGSPKENVEKALRRENPEYVPAGIFLGGSWPVIKAGRTLEGLIGNPEETAEIFIETNKRLNADVFMVGTGSTALVVKALGGEVRFNKKGAPEIMSPLIKGEADLDRLKIEDVFGNTAIKWLVETARCIDSYNKNIRLVLASGRAPFTLAAQMYGLEETCKALYKNKRFVHKLLEFTTEISITYYEEMITKGLAHGAFIADPTASGDVISKKHFEEFVLPYLKRVIGTVRDMGKPTMLHICGDISDRLPLIADTGVDCVSVDTKVDIKEAKEAVGDSICIAGNVCPVDILQFGTKEAVAGATLDCIRKGAGKGGFILLPGCDLAAGVPEENIKVFVDTAHQWFY